MTSCHDACPVRWASFWDQHKKQVNSARPPMAIQAMSLAPTFFPAKKLPFPHLQPLVAGFLPGRVGCLLSFTLALKIEFSSSSSPLLRRCCVIPASSDQCLYKKHCQPPSPSSIPIPPLRFFFFLSWGLVYFILFYFQAFSSHENDLYSQCLSAPIRGSIQMLRTPWALFSTE